MPVIGPVVGTTGIVNCEYHRQHGVFPQAALLPISTPVSSSVAWAVRDLEAQRHLMITFCKPWRYWREQ